MLGPLGRPTVLQPVKKLNKIAESVITATSGPVGLGQRIAGIIGAQWTSGVLKTQSSTTAMTTIRQAIGPIIVTEIQYATQFMQLSGGASQSLAWCTTILAAPIEGRVRLYQFGPTGDPEEATPDLPFVALGSGQPLADPFLAFLRAIFWKQAQPSTSDGIFATVWALLHAIRTNPGGVAEPIQLMTLENSDGNYILKEIDEEDLQETRQAVTEAEEYLSHFERQAAQQPVPEPPQIS
jgi:20S proteasome alpha/beta subunit